MAPSLATSRGRGGAIALVRGLSFALDVGVIVYTAILLENRQLSNPIAILAGVTGILVNVLELIAVLDSTGSIIRRSGTALCSFLWLDIIALALGIAGLVASFFVGFDSSLDGLPHPGGSEKSWTTWFVVEITLLGTMSLVHILLACSVVFAGLKRLSGRKLPPAHGAMPLPRSPVTACPQPKPSEWSPSSVSSLPSYSSETIEKERRFDDQV